MAPCTIWCWATTLPCDSRLSARSHIMSKASLTCATVRIAWWMRPPPRRRCASPLAPLSGPGGGGVGGHAPVVVADVVVQDGIVHDLHARRLPRDHVHAVGAHHEDDVGPGPGAGEPLL